MNKNDQNVIEAQGAEKQGVPDLKTVKEWTKRDIGLAIGVLNAIYSDPDLCNSMAEWIHGRIMNDYNRKVNGNK